MKIGIIGAGVAGCIMARSLARLPGVEVACLERVAPDDQSEAGTGLNVGPNAVKALRAHDPALAAAVDAAAFPWKSWRVSLTEGRELFHLPLDRVAASDGWRIRWSELYRVLRQGAGPLVRYGCTITDVNRGSATDRGGLSVAYEQDRAAARLDGLDLLIATDGRYSQVRTLVSGPPDISQVGIAIFRLLVPDTSGGLIDDYEQWFNGPNRLLAFKVPPAHIYIAGTFPIAPDGPVPAELRTAAALAAAYSPKGVAPGAQARWMIDQITAHAGDIHWARMQEHDVLYADPQLPVLYLGDSAHGMVPTLGQGATQAIEDACFAADLITDAWTAGRRDVRAWLDAISAARAQRVRFAMEFSMEASDTMFPGSDPVAGTLKKTEPAFLAKLERLYQGAPKIHEAAA